MGLNHSTRVLWPHTASFVLLITVIRNTFRGEQSQIYSLHAALIISEPM